MTSKLSGHSRFSRLSRLSRPSRLSGLSCLLIVCLLALNCFEPSLATEAVADEAGAVAPSAGESALSRSAGQGALNRSAEDSPPSRSAGDSAGAQGTVATSVGLNSGMTAGGGNLGVRLRPALAVSAFLLASAAVVFEVQSDRAYERYLDTADPRRIASYYDDAKRKGDLCTAALVGAELSAVAFVSTYLFQKRPPEPEPGTVIIGLAATPAAVGLRVQW